MVGKLGRGFLLALAVSACMTIRGRVDFLAAYGLGDHFFLALGLMMIPGAFLASILRRIRARRQPREKTSWRRCALCFAGGLLMILGAGLAGGGDGLMLAGLAQGSVSAYVFLGVSSLAAVLTARLMERRQGA